MSKIKNERAFTLIEALLVMTVLLVVCSVIVQFTIKNTEKFLGQQLAYEILIKFREAQYLAKANQIQYIFLSKNNTFTIMIDNRDKDIYYEQPMPKGAQLEIGSKTTSVVRTKTDMKMSGIFYVHVTVGDEIYKFNGNLGKGRFTIAED